MDKFEMKNILMCWLLASIVPQSAGPGTGTTTCTSPAVPRGRRGNVTCHFARDINLIDSVVYSVDHYPSEDSTGNEILSCTRVNRGQSDCKVSPGYTFDMKISNTLVLDIESASEQNTGRYACKVMSSDFRPDLDTCSFQLADGPAPTTPTTDVDAAQETDDTNIGMIAGIVVGILAAVIISILVFVLRRRCRESAAEDSSQITNPAQNDSAPQVENNPKTTDNDDGCVNETTTLLPEENEGTVYDQGPSAASPRSDRSETTTLLPEENEGTANDQGPSAASPRSDSHKRRSSYGGSPISTIEGVDQEFIQKEESDDKDSTHKRRSSDGGSPISTIEGVDQAFIQKDESDDKDSTHPQSGPKVLQIARSRLKEVPKPN